jgi:hypothetical protein
MILLPENPPTWLGKVILPENYNLAGENGRLTKMPLG